MTATAVIEEIKQLPREEQSHVIEFVNKLARKQRQLSGEELGKLAKQMVETKDPAEAKRLREEIVRGFYGDDLMPKVRRQKLREALLRHLLARVRQREISDEQIIFLSRWLDTDPEVPEGKRFKKFPGMTVCGEGELIKTFLQPGQLPTGEELK